MTRVRGANGPKGPTVDVVMTESTVTVVDRAGKRRVLSLEQATTLRVEDLLPVRLPKTYRKARHATGRYVFSRTGEIVVYESWLEYVNIVLLDFSGEYLWLLGQPVLLTIDGSAHYPDLLARCADGSLKLFDVKPAQEAVREPHLGTFRARAAACMQLGWAFDVLSEPPNEILLENVLYLAGFRFQSALPEGLVDHVVGACTTPCEIGALDVLGLRALVRPAVLHLLWTKQLTANLAEARLDRGTIVVAAGQTS